MIAAHIGDQELVKQLLKYNPLITLKDKFGKTAKERSANSKIRSLIENSHIEIEKIQRKNAKPQTARKTSVTKNDASDEYDSILALYRKHFLAKINPLKEGLSESSKHILNTVIHEELTKCEEFIRGIYRNDASGISDKMIKQIDQHIKLKVKLGATKAGIKTEDSMKEINNESRNGADFKAGKSVGT